MSALHSTLSKLSDKSRRAHYNVYERFDWPESIEPNRYWMSPELLSVHGSDLAREVPEDQLMELSKWEWINFLAINIHGIKELMAQVVSRIHTNRFMDSSDFFHHFLHEENAHMWFFAEFSKRYGGKIYGNKNIFVRTDQEKEIEDFTIFSRILIIERIVGYYNGEMKDDHRLPPIIVELNKVHFEDESRHLAMGHQMVRDLGRQVQQKFGPERLSEVLGSLDAYADHCVSLLYNPTAYRDAGFSRPLEVRNTLLKDPARKTYNAFLRDYSLKDFRDVEWAAA